MCENAREAKTSKNQCSICGAPINIGEYDIRAKLTQRMKAGHICFTCAFWKDKIENPHPLREVMNGCHYVLHPWTNCRIPFQGAGGHAYYVLKNDGTVVRSNNCWFQGEIPERFRAQLPDSARIIKKEAYKKIKSQTGFKCRKKGCWDRYHCYFYDLDIEKETGPWNQIPDNHSIGNEECESFLNKDTMYV